MSNLICGKHSTEWITISVDEYEGMKATIETLGSPEAMKNILKGEKELSCGKGKTLDELKKELGC